MHSLIGEYDSRWCFSYLPKRAPRSKGLLTVLPKPISLPKPITLNLLCIFVTTSLLKIRISQWWMLNKTTLLSHILLTFNKLLCKFAPKINVTELLSLERHSLGWLEAGGGRREGEVKLASPLFPFLHAHWTLTSMWTCANPSDGCFPWGGMFVSLIYWWGLLQVGWGVR